MFQIFFAMFAFLLPVVALGLAIYFFWDRLSKVIDLIVTSLLYEIIYAHLGISELISNVYASQKGKCIDLPNRRGHIAIITGGTRGIGLEVIKMLVECEIRVVIGCRNVEAGEAVAKKIKEEKPNSPDIKVYQLDLTSLQSVEQFAEKIAAAYPKINYLINNAGIMFGPFVETVDGYESQFQTNYLGHFLLTHLLMPNIKAASGPGEINARIVNVSSSAHFPGAINFKNINHKNIYIPPAAYAQSKVAQLMFTRHLNRLLQAEGAKVQVHAVHPGVVDTELFNNAPLMKIFPFIQKYFFKKPVEGAVPIMYATVAEELENTGGTYISNCEISRTSKLSKDEYLQEKLFNFTNDLLKISQFGKP